MFNWICLYGELFKITSNGQIMLIYAGDSILSGSWDDRYNSEVGYNRGINNYGTSRVRESLESLYESNDEDEAILSDDDRSKLVSFDLCISKRNAADTTKIILLNVVKLFLIKR